MGQIRDMNMFQIYGHLVNNVNMVLDSQYQEDIDATMLADFVGMLLEVHGLTEEVLAMLIDLPAKKSEWTDVDELLETENTLADLISHLLIPYGRGMADGVIMNLIYRFDMDEGPGPYLKVVSEEE